MWLLRIKFKPTYNNGFIAKKLVRSFSTALSTDSEYTAVPQYPPILDLSYEKELERRKIKKHEEIKAVRTVEEKQIKLNMDKYYGFKCYMFHEDFVPYNDLELIQHITRTHLIVGDSLPAFYEKIEIDELCNNVKSNIEDAILCEYTGIKRQHEIDGSCLDKAQIEDAYSTSITRQINRIVLNALSNKYSHLLDVQVDHDPRIESSWHAGGMAPPENIKKYRRGKECSKPFENEPTDRIIQYIGLPSVTVRSQQPLQPVLPYSEAVNTDLHVPYFRYDPRVVRTFTEHRYQANIPGFWPGDPYQFGLVSYHKRGHMLNRYFNDPIENKEALHRQGILSSFAWLNAQANFLGFTTFNDINYPLVTQAIVTNGQVWSFYVYQLNTLLVHSKNTSENPKRNVCWATPELQLFDTIDNGKLLGFNDDVLRKLIKLYTNAPVESLATNMRPYLSEKEKISADYENDEKRGWLEREYKFLVANRPRYKPMDEMYAWEKIYKVDHKTRPMERRFRFFEVFKKPSDRKLSDRKPAYIPRVLRPHLPKYKGRNANEYFP